MTKDQQIAALQARLAEIDASIQRLQAARDASTVPQERRDLFADIVMLQATRESILQAINNLQTSDVTFAAAAADDASTSTRDQLTALLVSLKAQRDAKRKRREESTDQQERRDLQADIVMLDAQIESVEQALNNLPASDAAAASLTSSGGHKKIAAIHRENVKAARKHATHAKKAAEDTLKVIGTPDKKGKPSKPKKSTPAKPKKKK